MDIVKVFEDGIDILDAERGEWDESKLHISDLGVCSGIPKSDRKCPRALWYRLNGARKEPSNAGKKLMFLQGHRLESIVVEALQRASVICDTQVTAGIASKHEEDMIFGTADLLIHTLNGLLVVDIKTRRGNSFRYSTAVKEAEKMQVLGYAYALSNFHNAYATSGAILEVDREGQNFARIWEFPIGEEEFGKVEMAINEIRSIRHTSTPPDGFDATLIRKENKGDDALKLNIPWQCRYCPYADTVCDYRPDESIREQHGKVVGHIDDEGKRSQNTTGIPIKMLEIE